MDEHVSSRISPVSLAIPSFSISMTMGGRVNLNRSVSPRNLHVLSRRKDTFPSISVYQWTIKIQPRRRKMIQQIWKVHGYLIIRYTSVCLILQEHLKQSMSDIKWYPWKPFIMPETSRNDVSLARIPLQQLCTPKFGWNLKRLVLKLIITS